jgi:hypothetical protein
VTKVEPTLKTTVEAPLQKPASTFHLVITVALRILGVRKKQPYEEDIERMTPMQVGFACILALITFTAIMAMLAILAVKYMG